MATPVTPLLAPGQSAFQPQAPINFGGSSPAGSSLSSFLGLSTPSFSMANSTPAMAPAKPVVPAVPQSTLPANMSTVNGPVYAPPPVIPSAPATPSIPNIPATTPAALAPTNPSNNGALITTPSGAVVNQYTGALVTPAPGSTTPTVPNSIYGTSTQGLAAAGANGTPAIPSIVSGLSTIGASNPATSGAGVAGVDTAEQNLAQFETALQTSLGNTGSQPIPMPFIQGQQQVIGQQNQGILSALSNAVTQAQTGVQLGISGTQTQANALNEAGSLATGAQSLQQQALEQAGQLTTPVAGASFFGTPETGGMVGTGSAAMQAAVALQVQKLQNGTTDPASAAAALSAYGQAGTNALQAALGPNFNLPAAAGSAAATESNTTLGATATPTAENAVYQQATSDYANLQQAVSNVSGLGSTLTSGMTDANGNVINPTSSTYANMSIAQFKTQLSSPQQAQFNSTLAALTAKVSGMLSIGGSETPTQLTTDANSIINGSAPMGTLQATLDRIQSEGNTLLTNQAEKVNTAKANITPPSTTTLGTGGSTSNPFSASNFFGS